mmetsp:Transcript_4245/g.7862  ORF Transcript_4245/g.7862 Transcript_4245/m.7862 type:complete len:219 (+) Transcript_4245:509-1165(+)
MSRRFPVPRRRGLQSKRLRQFLVPFLGDVLRHQTNGYGLNVLLHLRLHLQNRGFIGSFWGGKCVPLLQCLESEQLFGLEPEPGQQPGLVQAVQHFIVDVLVAADGAQHLVRHERFEDLVVLKDVRQCAPFALQLVDDGACQEEQRVHGGGDVEVSTLLHRLVDEPRAVRLLHALYFVESAVENPDLDRCLCLGVRHPVDLHIRRHVWAVKVHDPLGAP